ncbi:MAG: hypothetical protein VB835_08235, partial [Pirellulales bacterium]
ELVFADVDLAGASGAGVSTVNEGREDTQYALSFDRISGLNPMGIWFSGFETADVSLNDDDSNSVRDNVFIAGTHAIENLNVRTGGGGDIVNIQATNAATTVEAGSGDDIIRVNYDNLGLQTFESGLGDVLNLHGQRGADTYLVGLAGRGSAWINVHDQTPADDRSVDTLDIFGSDQTDYFLFRPNSISSVELDANRQPKLGGEVERVNYNGEIGAASVYGREGDDRFIFDDTSSSLVVYGQRGDDSFQVGQMYNSPREANAGLAEEDQFPTTHTTDGFLSNGVTQPAELRGGPGNDSFTVFHNKAELGLFGEEDDDAFLVRAFVAIDPNDPKAPYTNINGGQGADFISYTINAPVRIEGGDGLDTLTIIGTAFGDDFVVTDNGIFGAGLFINYGGIEKVTADGLEGNDRFFVASTNERVDVSLFGGQGSDTFDVSGGNDGEAITVVSNDLLGHSGLLEHTISSDSRATEYDRLFTRDIVANVGDNDEPGVIILPPSGPIRVFEGAMGSTEYHVVLTRSPDEEEDVRVTVAPVKSKQSVTVALETITTGTAGVAQVQRLDLADAVEGLFILNYDGEPTEPIDAAAANLAAEIANKLNAVSANVQVASPSPNVFNITSRTAGERSAIVLGNVANLSNGAIGVAVNGQEEGVALLFDQTNWFVPQALLVTAPDDGLPEGTKFVTIQHSVTQGVTDGDGSPYDKLSVRSVVAEVIDNDTAGVVILDGHDRSVAEHEDLTTVNNAYRVVLTQPPAGSVTVDVGVDSGQLNADKQSLVFTDANWSVPQLVTLTAVNDRLMEGRHFSRVTHNSHSSDLRYQGVAIDSIDVAIDDNDAPGVVITETGGVTRVTEPTDRVVMGTGQVTGSVAGRTFIGSFGTAIISENGNNDRLDTPQDIGLGKWSNVHDPEIGDGNGNTSATIPHITVKGTGDDTRDYYSFEVTEKMIVDSGKPIRAIFDIDHGTEPGDNVFWWSQLNLYKKVEREPGETGPAANLFANDGVYYANPAHGAA